MDISAELPDCLKTTYSKEKAPAGLRRSTSRRAMLGAHSSVSPDAPESFQNSFLTSSAKRYGETPSPPRFAYEDMSRQNSDSKDFSTIRPRHYFDTLNSRNQGVKSRLPYYCEYYKTLRSSGFGIHEGMCTSELRKCTKEIHRSESRQLHITSDSPRCSHARQRSDAKHYSPKSDLKTSFEKPVFVSEKFRVKLPTLRLRQFPMKAKPVVQSSSEAAKAAMLELDIFDRRRKSSTKQKSVI